MICKPCKNAADKHKKVPDPSDLITVSYIRSLHNDCTGCDCQHRVVPSSIVGNTARGGAGGTSDGAAAVSAGK